ncbi:Inversin, partial [Echria macrotheca]
MESDIEHARCLLQAQRSLPDGKAARVHLPFSARDDKSFSYQEVNAVLANVLDSDGPLNLVRALLSFGADINFSKRRSHGALSKLNLRQGRTHRSDLLLRATVRCRAETVRLLASHADQENLDSVLHTAIVRGDLDVLQALLDYGANPVGLHEDFQNVIFDDRVDLVRALLSGHRLPCLSCRSAGLRLAVKNQSLEIAALLLERWADVNHDNAAALVKAVEISRPDIVATLLSGPVRPSPRTLDIGLSKALAMEKDTPAGRDVIEMCLSLGASGPGTNRLLTEGVVDAVKRGQILLLDTVLRLRRLPEESEALAIQQAIRSEQLEALRKILDFGPSRAALTAGVLQAMEVYSSKLRYEIIIHLLRAGATRECNAEALIRAVHLVTTPGDKMRRDQELDRRLFSLLLDEGKADVDYRQGEAVQLAVQAVRADLVEEIVMKRPSPDSLGAALPWAMSVSDGEAKRTLVGMLLVNPVCEVAAGRALVDAFRDGTDNLDFVEMLLTRASVNYNNGEVFIYAVRKFDPKAFALLLDQDASYKALFTAVMEALRAPIEPRLAIFKQLLRRLSPDHLNTSLKHVVLQSSKDLALVEMLLEAGAEARHQDGVCIKYAACNLDLDLIRLLTQHSGIHEPIFTQAFSGVIGRGRQWIAFEHIEIVQLLIHHGASGNVIDKAVIEVVDHVASKNALTNLGNTLLNILFTAGATVNSEEGKAVCLAAEKGDPFLFVHLLKHDATAATASLALSAGIVAKHDEKLLLQLIKIFSSRQVSKTDIAEFLPGTHNPILLCLKSYPESVALVEALIKAGCDLHGTIPFHIYADNGTSDGSQEPEAISILMSTFLQDYRISPAVFRALIRLGADISYTTPKTQTTALMLAAMAGRRSITRILLESGAKSSSRDVYGRSALYFASRSGDANLVALLLKTRPSPNDGALHEASRRFHTQVMRLLLKAGHDPNYRSPRHGGRTALGELALNAVVPADTTAMEEALDILTTAGASPLLKVDGKTTVFLALDNQQNEHMTQVLLQKVLRSTIHSHENTYQQGIYHYSPTAYVAKGILLGPHSDALIQMLRVNGVEDRFYASPGEQQPPDAVGLPDEIRE